jgi:hypothetical protein
VAAVEYDESTDTFDVYCYDDGCNGFLGEYDREFDANQVADGHEDWHDDND